ncbi:MAG: mechanosensitive ion channel family protein [Rhodobacterales bacterium]|nr:mechanosensitive ion channel family protein [Rhodobacterales bacterium]
MTAGAQVSLRACLAAFLVWLALAVSAPAQSDLDYATWENLAARVETTLESGRASDLVLAQLRVDVVVWRERFLAAQGINETRIATLQAQLAALGPPPGETDPPETADLTTRRSELAAQLARLQAPRRTAEEAYNRAGGLIREIDTTLRDRQAAEALSLGPSPLNPALWSPALTTLRRSLDHLRVEVIEGLGAAGATAMWRQNLLPLVFFLAVALALVLRGRAWMEWLTLRFYGGSMGDGSPAIAFVVSLGQVIVPVLGMFALREAAFLSGLLGLRGQIMAQALPLLGVMAFGAVWLGARVFPRRDTISGPIPLSGDKRAEGRVYAMLLGLLLCADFLLRRLAEFDRYDTATRAVLFFPLLVIGGIVLFRLGLFLVRVRLNAPPQDGAQDRQISHFGQMIRLLGRVTIVIGGMGPVLAAVGYGTAANLVIYPAVLSLALLSLLAVLRLVSRDFFALFRGLDEARANEALTPILIVFALSILSLPVFALIWGARVTDLSELWTRFREGFSIGESRISPSDFLVFLLVFALGYGLTRLLQGTLKNAVLPKTHIDTGGRNAIVAGIGYVGILLAVIFAITSAGINLSSLAIVAGALSVGIGFGLQNIVSNFVSGIILLIERPISEGDWIEVGGNMGYVRDISVRSTRIETFDRTDVIVPNADFVSGTVTNWTRGNLTGRIIVPVGVAYGTDTRLVERVLRDIAEAHPLVVVTPPPAVLFIDFGADSLNFEIRAILRDVNFSLAVKSDMNHAIVARFAEQRIEIPFAQRDIWLRNPEALSPRPPPAKATTPDPETRHPAVADAALADIAGPETMPPESDDARPTR